MPTLSDKIAQELALAQAELARIQTEAATKTATVNNRIAALTAAQAAVTPDVESLIGLLSTVGIKVSFSS